MRAIMVMYDSLNRRFLQSYGCDWTKTPNFLRAASRCVQFDNSWVCSMPCMPARRELHTGRANFLHRSWGPVEPYDDSMPEILKKNGIYTHLVSDHQHYWEDGGATYHNRYNSWEISRGQEGDLWKADLKVGANPETIFEGKKKMIQAWPAIQQWYAHDERNRRYMDTEEKTSQAVTFAAGLEFLENNHGEDNWFLQIETFDPHEPFYVLKEDRALYPDSFCGDANDDWPPYSPVEEDDETVAHVRRVYAALVSKCDRYLGRVLDFMDEHDMWKDTMLIINTDHGFLLGEHGWWGKTSMPLYEEISRTPMYIYDPRHPELGGQRRQSLVQTIDLAPTLLSFFGMEVPQDMLGHDLEQVLTADTPVREYAVFGYHGSQINVTDGRYIYQHAAEHPEMTSYEYTLMPTHMRQIFSPAELQDITLAEPFSFTKGCRLMKIEKKDNMGNTNTFGSNLYDLVKDPDENAPLDDAETICRMKTAIRNFLDENDAPAELYERYGFT